MIKNYIKIALRNLRKNKIDSAISIGGLAVGLACCILLVFYVRFEWSHDNFHENADQVYRITDQTTVPSTGKVQKSLTTPYPLPAALDSAFPEIDRVLHIAEREVKLERDGKFRSQPVTYTDEDFFEVFTFPLLHGSPESALGSPEKVVITEDIAQRVFGQKNVVGETLTFKMNEQNYPLTVSAVAQSIPANSSIKFEVILPFENYFRNYDPEQAKMYRENWHIGFAETWLTLNESSDPKSLEAKFPEFLKTKYGDFAEFLKMEMGLQVFEGAYFNQEYTSYITGNSNPLYSNILGGIALIILAIAGMNFMSLTLSRAYRRSHEMGIRKAAGAQSRQIHFQIFGEILLTCSLAFVFGMMLAEISSPFFQQLTGKTFEVQVINDPILWGVLALMILLVTIITGLYPALKMSRKKASLLFSSQRSAERIPVFVKGLICTQFALAIAFLIATFTMNHQLNYLLNKDLGFSTSNIITVELDIESEKGKQVAELLSSEVRRLPGIQHVSTIGGHYRSGKAGFGMGRMMTSTTLEGFDTAITLEIVDEYYLATMNIELLSGRNFSPERPSDIQNGILVNQTFVETMGWENPVGQIISDKNERWSSTMDGKEVIGVVSDFHFKPLYEQLQPIALQHINSRDYGPPGTILVKTSSGNLSATISSLSELWESIAPEEIFNYNFLDEMVALQYMEEQRWRNIIQFASFMAIALACFGLFGLAALSAQRRTKEIGIRKVMGATLTNIVTLLSKDFVKLVIAGFIIAIPIAWYAINQWLSEFAYRIEVGPGIFIFAGVIALTIALLTVSWQSIKAALANPVESLRSE
ncbi:MAG: ABC transporter permease [Gracilimonas sp.]|uniref:ABC transporter permease n=1 Tax=Gracilimonas sp. TaxID=1974203 RepID=UPI00199D78BE|nr:ABC transporter permease [Gracilimonas sp.]MBD3616748.1 ABC transporter permease [Gracilimonas sp.]